MRRIYRNGPLIAVLGAAAIVIMLICALVAYSIPSARGDVLRDPAGTSGTSSWTVVD